MALIYFITKTELTQEGFIHGNVSSQIVNPAIIRVQDRFLKSTIGRDFYKHLQTAKSDGTLTEMEEYLLEEYIRPYLTAEVEIKVIRELNAQQRNKTVGNGTDANFQKTPANELYRTTDDKKNDATHYRNELIQYLVDYSEDFPLACPPCKNFSKNFSILTNYSQHNRSKF